jgi:DNA-binding transcriptional MerR regulator
MGYSVRHMTRRTGLRRHQLLYLEERGLLGYVARSDGRRTYTVEQLELIERMAHLRRALDIGVNEAALIAAETRGGPAAVSTERLVSLVLGAMDGTERRAAATRQVAELLSRRARSRADRHAA